MQCLFTFPLLLPQYNGTIFLLAPDATNSNIQMLAWQLTQSIQRAQDGQPQGRPVVEPVSSQTVWVGSSEEVNQRLYCGYSQVGRSLPSLMFQYCSVWHGKDQAVAKAILSPMGDHANLTKANHALDPLRACASGHASSNLMQHPLLPYS